MARPTARTGTFKLFLATIAGLAALLIGIALAGLCCMLGATAYDGWSRDGDSVVVAGAALMALTLAFLAALCFAAAWLCLVNVPRQFVRGRVP